MKKETKNIIKGFLLWILNNSFAIRVLDSACEFMKNIILYNEISTVTLLQFVLWGIPWLISGGIIIISFVYSKRDKCIEIGDIS